ncbi:low molecular weight protein arginine phosphatase [Chloroflexota bacterium]
MVATILCVCTGNVCRSPMAEGILRQRLANQGLGGQHRVFSAGVWALDGRPASENARQVMKEKGIDISDHIAHSIAASDVSDADLILVMSREHQDMIVNTWSQYRWKVYRLSEMTGKRKDVRDPYGGTLDEYRACADIISGYIDLGLERILQLA